jgi:hypothetical protein
MTNQTKFNEFEEKLARSLQDLEMLKSRFRDMVQEADELGLNTTENFWPINYLSGIHSDLVTAANRAFNLYGENFKPKKQ